MLFTNLDNAFDSLNWAIKHFNTLQCKDLYFDSPGKSYTYLKQGIMCLNTSLDLFVKEQNNTIDKLCVNDYLVKSEQGMETNDSLYFKKKYYNLIGSISEVLCYLEKDFLKKIPYNKQKIEDYCSEIFNIRSYFIEAEKNIWLEIFNNNIVRLCKNIEAVFNSDKVKVYFQKSGVYLKFSYEDLENIYACTVTNNITENILNFSILPKYSAVIITTDLNDDLIFDVFLLDEVKDINNFYKCKLDNGIKIQNCETEEEFWKNQQNFYLTEYNNKTLEEAMTKVLSFSLGNY